MLFQSAISLSKTGAPISRVVVHRASVEYSAYLPRIGGPAVSAPSRGERPGVERFASETKRSENFACERKNFACERFSFRQAAAKSLKSLCQEIFDFAVLWDFNGLRVILFRRFLRCRLRGPFRFPADGKYYSPIEAKTITRIW